jgi:ATP-binding cassette subfamily B protein/subfamily B ATP-binding cassette protein MsbA
MIHTLATLAPYFAEQRWKLLAIAGMSCLFSLVAVLQPWPIKLLVDIALSGGMDSSGLQPVMMIWVAAAATLGLFLINAALDVAVSWAWMAAGQRMVYDLAADVYERLLSMPSITNRRRVGDCLERLSADSWCVYTIASDLLVAPLQNVLTLGGIAIVAWQLDPRLAAISFLTAPVMAASVMWYGPKLKRRARQGRELQSHLASFVHQTVTSIPLVQAYGAENRNQQHFESLVDDVVAITQRGVLVNKSFALLNGLASAAGRAIVLFVGGLQVLQGNTTVGNLLIFMAYIRTMQGACENLLKVYAKVKSSEASVERLAEILHAATRLPKSGERLPLSASECGCSIRFQNVSFDYGPGKPALRDVSLEIAAGERVAIVGASGAGKSTLVSLVLRLIEADQGTVEIDGIDVRRLDLDTLRSRIAIVLQEPFLLPGTIADNIRIGKPNASLHEIRAAAEAAGAHEFIDRLPLGYETVVGERGATLSGGQQQRIAIARAFVRQAPIVILDEPTSSLDSATELQLMEGFKRLTEGRTSIIISHRLSTIRDADRVIVLREGRVVESGKTTELLAMRGHFHRFHHATYHGTANQEVVA